MTKNGSGSCHRLLPGRDLPFLHRFEQRGLRLRRRAVDFVGEHDVREDRPVDEAELALAVRGLVEDRRAGDVGGHQVGRELDALERDVENLRDRADHERLGQAGHADEQAVPAGEDGGEDLLDDLGLADDDAAELVEHRSAVCGELSQVIREAVGSGHRRPSCVAIE